MEYGGYLPLELAKGDEYYANDYSVLRLNSGRSALAVACIENNIDKLWIPYYNCSVVKNMLSKYCECKFYYLDNELNPVLDNIEQNEWVLIVNYFGNKDNNDLKKLQDKYCRIIIDNTQAFFTRPLAGSFNIYSCRKFFGVSDGAYLITDKSYIFKNRFPCDKSWERISYLMKCIEEGTNAAYHDSLIAEEDIGYEIFEMSPLTRRILESIDYNRLLEIRSRNLKILSDGLSDINEIEIRINIENNLIAYPLLIHDKSFRTKLIEKKIYVPQWWKYLQEIVKEESIEYEYSDYLTMIPIDQRYDEEHMYNLVKIIRSCLE